MAGWTYSSDFPTTTGAYDTSFNGGSDVFVSKFDRDLSASPPLVTTGSATNVTSSSATLNGTVNANDLSTTAWFEYGTASGSYSNTSLTMGISGGSSDWSVSINISGLSAGTTYYYRLIASNIVGITYGNEESFTTLTLTTGNLVGRVTNAVTGTGLVGATITADGQTTETTTGGAYVFRDIAVGDYTVTAFADGYLPNSTTATVNAGQMTRADILLTPQVPTPTPSPVTSPTPTCNAAKLDAELEPLELKKEESADETVRVTCENGEPKAGITVTATVAKGKKRVSVSPTSAVTNANGQAIFTITAKKKTGKAKVRFEADGLTDTMTVKVR